MQEHHKQLDDFFHRVSRYIFIVPIIVVFVALFLKFSNNQQKGFREYNTAITPTKALGFLDNLNQSTPSAKFNLTGPLSCSFSAESSAVNVYVKEKKIYIKMEEKNVTSNYLLNGDCVYMWKNGLYTGDKICGISQQVSIVEGLLSSGFISPDLIFGSLGKMFDLPEVSGSQDVLKSAMNSCKNEDIPEFVRFDIPKNVLFKNKVTK